MGAGESALDCNCQLYAPIIPVTQHGSESISANSVVTCERGQESVLWFSVILSSGFTLALAELISKDAILVDRASAPERIELDPLVAPERLRARLVRPLRGRASGGM